MQHSLSVAPLLVTVPLLLTHGGEQVHVYPIVQFIPLGKRPLCAVLAERVRNLPGDNFGSNMADSLENGFVIS